MRMLRFDSVGGASGDMILAALIDAGAPIATLRKALASLPIEPFTLKIRKVTRDGQTATQVDVDVPHLRESRHPHSHHGEHDHDHDHPHDHDHEHGHVHGGEDPHGHALPHHHHRTMRQIRGILRRSRLPARVKTLSLAVFERLALAEGRVHGVAPDDVHFHEVGAVDSIVDIAGACLALELLDIQAVDVGPLPEGQGFVQCAHGVMPIPVPATAELLKGHPVSLTREPFELVTPTGAALLMTWKSLLPASGATSGCIREIGTGFGTRTLRERPNILRALLIETEAPAADGGGTCLVLECNLDDSNPEWIGSLTTTLLEAGALDVFTTAVQMKKQRPGTLLTVLCPRATRDRMLDLIFRESTTFGVREHMATRTMLERRHVGVKTAFGSVRVKEGFWKGRVVTRAPEHDDCARAAKRHEVPLRTVYAAALATRPRHKKTDADRAGVR
jgi:pyridinium-3,5-bisthiocarboxylic acid mononucleotide nickel chelatase